MQVWQIAVLGALGVAGVVVYRKYIRAGEAAGAAALLETAAEDPQSIADAYEQTVQDHASWIAGSRRTDGSMMFQPRVALETVKQHLVYPYVALVREATRNNIELAQERGESIPGSVWVTQKGTTNPWLVKHKIARIFLFNPATGSEVPLWQLRKESSIWTPDMAAVLEGWYANAFNYACRISPGYDQFENKLKLTATGQQTGASCDVRYNVSL